MRLNYDEISPITGNLCVLVEMDQTQGQNMRLCMESGYHTFDNWKEGSEAVNIFLSAAPELIKDTAVVDEDQQVWVKIIMMTPDVVLNPDAQISDDGVKLIWKVSSFKFIPEGELPEPKLVSVQVGERFKVLDDDSASVFEDSDFENATLEFYNRVAYIEDFHESTD